MKIALVHDYLINFSGAEQVLLALHELYPSAPIYTAIYNKESCPQFNDATVHTSFLQTWPLAKTKYRQYIPLLPLANESYDLSAYDVVISDCHIATKGVITKPETIHISYCHTPIRYAWLSHIDPRASGSFMPWLSPIARAAAHYLRIWDSLAADRVDHWVANSKYIANRIDKYYRKTAKVIYPPVNVEAFEISEKIEDYYVFCSRLIDYKLPDIVIDAFNILGKKLIVIGRGPMAEQLKAKAMPNVKIMTEYLPNSQLAVIFSHASAMIFPAEEDFGIVMVEMMAAGRPVIAYHLGGASEIVIPGKTGELFTLQTPEAIIKAVAAFDPMGYDGKVIREHALKYDRSAFKKQLEEYIDTVIKKER